MTWRFAFVIAVSLAATVWARSLAGHITDRQLASIIIMFIVGLFYGFMTCYELTKTK